MAWFITQNMLKHIYIYYKKKFFKIISWEINCYVYPNIVFSDHILVNVILINYMRPCCPLTKENKYKFGLLMTEKTDFLNINLGLVSLPNMSLVTLNIQHVY